MTSTIKWTREAIVAASKIYPRRVDLQKKAAGAYSAARKYFPGLLDELYGEYFTWKEEDARIEALKYKSKGELQQKDGSMYSIILRRFPHLLKECYVPIRYKWDRESVIDAINMCSSQQEFVDAFPGALRAMEREYEDLFDLLPSSEGGTDNDAIYIWKAVSQFFNGTPVYKIGITSSRLGTKRIESVAGKWGFDYELICCEKVQGRATLLEAKLHILGENPKYEGIDGATEFRALSDSALYVAITLICERIDHE